MSLENGYHTPTVCSRLVIVPLLCLRAQAAGDGGSISDLPYQLCLIGTASCCYGRSRCQTFRGRRGTTSSKFTTLESGQPTWRCEANAEAKIRRSKCIPIWSFFRQESVSSSFTSISTDKTGCAVWECGIILAYCLCQAFLLRGKSSALKVAFCMSRMVWEGSVSCRLVLIRRTMVSSWAVARDWSPSHWRAWEQRWSPRMAMIRSVHCWGKRKRCSLW